MDTGEKFIGCGILVFIIAFVGFIVFCFTGLPITVGTGNHVGYITSTETTGVIFKTDRAYLKTDTQSSQEDSYCVLDKDVFNQLRALSDKHAHVQVNYVNHAFWGVSECAGEDDAIIGVSEIQ